MKFNKKDIVTLIGFVCFMIGMLSIILSLVGVHFSFLGWLENWGGLTAFLVKLAMATLGIILVYNAKTSTSTP